MISYVNRKMFSSHKAQISIFFIAIIATLIAITFVTIMIGKTAKDKTYTSNAADAGALAAASIMATGFNYVADQNDNGPDKRGSNKEEENRHVSQDHPSHQRLSNEMGHKNRTDQKTAHFASYTFLSPIAKAGDIKTVKEGAAQEATQTDLQDVHNKLYDAKKQEQLRQAMDDMQGDSGTPNNYYDNALSMAYKINFQNSGIHHRLGRLNQKLYDSFIDSIQPGTVQSGQPLVFAWVDGAARVHIVIAIIEIESPDNWQTKMARDDDATQQATSDTAKGDFQGVQAQGMSAGGARDAGIAAGLLIDAVVFTPVGSGFEHSAFGLMTSGGVQQDLHYTGIQEEGGSSDIIKTASQAEPKTVAYVEDIIHSQTVFSFNFQFHMGSPLKSIAGDIDIMTFYPPVASGAIAGFNCSGSGDISRGDANGDASATFAPCLLVTF